VDECKPLVGGVAGIGVGGGPQWHGSGGQGLPGVARHVIGYSLTQETRVQNWMDEMTGNGPDRCCSPHHVAQFTQQTRFKFLSMTWRAISACLEQRARRWRRQRADTSACCARCWMRDWTRTPWTSTVGRCRLPVSKPELKARLVSALESEV